MNSKFKMMNEMNKSDEHIFGIFLCKKRYQKEET